MVGGAHGQIKIRRNPPSTSSKISSVSAMASGFKAGLLTFSAGTEAWRPGVILMSVAGRGAGPPAVPWTSAENEMDYPGCYDESTAM